MISLDVPLARKQELPAEKHDEESAINDRPTVSDIDDDDLLATARGVMNGVLLGLIMWILIAMTWLVH